MAPEIIEPQFDLAAQEARELARRATLAPSDVEGPEPAVSTMEEPPKTEDPAAGTAVGASDGTAEQGESTQAP